MTGFRRDFDAEIAAAARQGQRVIAEKQPPKPVPILQSASDPRPETRTIVIAVQPRYLAYLLKFQCSIATVGADWHIRPRSRDETARIIVWCKLHRINGLLKTLNRQEADPP